MRHGQKFVKIFVEIGPRSRTISTYNTCWYCYYGVISPHTVCCGPCGPGSIALAVSSSYSPCFFIEWYQNFNILHHLIGLNFPIFVISYSGHCPLLRLQTRQKSCEQLNQIVLFHKTMIISPRQPFPVILIYDDDGIHVIFFVV